jgi:hypothetical protein
MIEKKSEFYLGLGLMIGFLVVLVFFFMPVFNGKNGLDYLDNLYNSISKGSAYYVPGIKKDVEKFANQTVTVNLQMMGEEQAAQTALLFTGSGAKVETTARNLTVTGDLAGILGSALVDADAMYWNKGENLSGKYGYREKKALYNWWKGMEEMRRASTRTKSSKRRKSSPLSRKRQWKPLTIIIQLNRRRSENGGAQSSFPCSFMSCIRSGMAFPSSSCSRVGGSGSAISETASCERPAGKDLLHSLRLFVLHSVSGRR